jgi:AcrR family transcriptional regulator
MEVKKLGRPKGQTKDTKQAILEASFKIFSWYGFAGTSMSHIAKEADVNQSLLYHHFSNKLDLWRAVKANLLKKFNPKYMNPACIDTLDNLINEYVDSRFDFYFENPSILRLLSWQRLDQDPQSLATNMATSEEPLYSALQSFQKKGMLDVNIDLQLLINMMANMTIAPLLDYPEIFKLNPNKILIYKNLVKKMILGSIHFY